jgi:hypothetical protein
MVLQYYNNIITACDHARMRANYFAGHLKENIQKSGDILYKRGFGMARNYFNT